MSITFALTICTMTLITCGVFLAYIDWKELSDNRKILLSLITFLCGVFWVVMISRGMKGG